ncbi:MAG: Vacuolar protein-sorting-associated protein 28 [Vezdaea aestivalis]|nr:MAG: Vacuolar protein-sorting-associated protein 28 [Vezdaea aestivalis]
MYTPTNRPQPYAPNSYASYPQATIPLHLPVSLTSSTTSRDQIDNLAEIHSVIVTLDALEKAYVKDSLAANPAAYTEACSRLLRQYKVLTEEEGAGAGQAELGGFEGFTQFCARWSIEAPRAEKRIKVGLPGTVSEASTGRGGGGGDGGRNDGGGQSAKKGPAATAILEATQDFITFLDALKLGLLAKDSLHPLLADVIQSVNKVTSEDFEGRGKIVQWLIALNSMRATEELDEARARELSFDMEGAYRGFKDALR